MKQTELAKLYQRTAATYKKNPTEAEADAWKAVLLSFSVADMEAALARHADDREFDDFRGAPKCTLMPSAAEIRYSITKFMQDQVEAKAGRFVPCDKNGCFEGWVRVPAGQWFNRDGHPARNDAVKACQCRLDYVARKSS